MSEPPSQAELRLLNHSATLRVATDDIMTDMNAVLAEKNARIKALQEELTKVKAVSEAASSQPAPVVAAPS